MSRDKPLKEEAFHILLTLVEGDAHGYSMMQTIESRTDGQVRLLPGALYRHLHRLLSDGWIEEVEGDGNTVERRRTYSLTKTGREGLGRECRRLEGLLAHARRLGLTDREMAR